MLNTKLKTFPTFFDKCKPGLPWVEIES